MRMRKHFATGAALTAAAAMIDSIAAKRVEAAGGTVVDDSGFIVTIGQLLEVGDAGSAPSA